MEKSKQILDSTDDEESPETIPPLIKAIAEHEVAGFDSFEETYNRSNFHPTVTRFHPSKASAFGIEPVPNNNDHLSINMPPSPELESHTPSSKRVNFSDTDTILTAGIPDSSSRVSNPQPRKTRFYSQPIPKGPISKEPIVSGRSAQLTVPPRDPTIEKFRDRRFDSFKTWSGKLERQISNLRGKHREEDDRETPENLQPQEMEPVPVDRYFDALEGPELETLRASEEIILPEDKLWPFLLRFPISSFGICLGVGSQAIMWKTLATSSSTKYLHVNLDVNLVLWIISVALVIMTALIYALKVTLYFEAFRREYYHPIRINFFFAPWLALLLLAIGVPPRVATHLPQLLWYVLMTPILLLELKIYGQWMSGGQRRLSKVANPTNHLSIVGNFVGALLGASMGLKEGPIFFFAIGLAHYMVLFVTLYQRLPTNETLPKELHPVFFLFVAAPSVASMAWANIEGSFGYGSKIMYFVALFLYFSLAVRVNFFRGFKFSLAWWAYTMPMTGAAIATVRYSSVVTTIVTKVLTVVLCTVSTLTVTALLVSTIIHAFVLHDLFPNDIAIAISDRKPRTRRWFHRRGNSADNVEQYLKYLNSDGKDIETSVSIPTCNDNGFPLSSSVSRDEERGHSHTNVPKL